MRKILVPTDFSANAHQALEYAITIANQFGATIHVLHAYQLASSTGHLVSIDNIVQEDREKELNSALRKIKPLLKNNTSVEGYVRKGSSVETICRAAEKLSVDLIVMGTTGASGMKKMFMGSTANNVIKRTELPVLAVPADFKEFKLDNITISVDDQKVAEPYVLHPAVELANAFKTEVNLLHVVDSAEDDHEIDHKLQDHLKQFGVGYTYFKLSAQDTSQGILEFINRKNSNLLCMIKHHRSWFQGLFHNSVSGQMAFESKVPILVLHG
jgi:nucleotide-binding universal stress UspA family protein